MILFAAVANASGYWRRGSCPRGCVFTMRRSGAHEAGAIEDREGEAAAMRQPAASVAIVPEARLRHDDVRDRGKGELWVA